MGSGLVQGGDILCITKFRHLYQEQGYQLNLSLLRDLNLSNLYEQRRLKNIVSAWNA